MRLSFSTLSFEEYDICALIDICKKYGYSGIEIRTGHGWGRLDLSDEELAEAKKMLDAEDLQVVGIGSSLHIRGYSEENTDAYKKELRIASALGAPGIRIMVGTYRHFKTQSLRPMDYPGAVRWMQDMCDLGAPYGVGLFIEAHNEYCTGKILKKLLDDVSRPNCKVIWDILHPLYEGESIEETYEYLKGHICHLHIKDGIDDPNPASLEYIYTPVGKGSVPIPSFIELLERNGHCDMFYSLEWEPKWKPELEVLGLKNEDVLREYSVLMKKYYEEL